MGVTWRLHQPRKLQEAAAPDAATVAQRLGGGGGGPLHPLGRRCGAARSQGSATCRFCLARGAHACRRCVPSGCAEPGGKAGCL